MKKKFAFAGIAAAAAIATSAAAENWDMPMAYADSNFHSQNGKKFAEAVGICTGGELTITVHAGGSLFKGNEIKRAVQTGQAKIGERLLSAHANENPLYGIDSVPFLATSYAASESLWNAAKDDMAEAMDAEGLVLLYSAPWPPQGIYFNQPINSVADMEGIKFRAYNVATSKLAELAGMLPVQIEAADLTQALATGVASAFVSSGSTGYDRKVWEHLSHFYDTQAWLPRNYVFANKKAFEALDDNKRNCLKSASILAQIAATARSEQLAGWYLAELAANGMSVQPPSEQLAADLAEIGQVMAAEWSESAGEAGMAIVDSFKMSQ